MFIKSNLNQRHQDSKDINFLVKDDFVILCHNGILLCFISYFLFSVHFVTFFTFFSRTKNLPAPRIQEIYKTPSHSNFKSRKICHSLIQVSKSPNGYQQAAFVSTLHMKKEMNFKHSYKEKYDKDPVLSNL